MEPRALPPSTQHQLQGAAADTFSYPGYSPSSFGGDPNAPGGRLSEPAKAALARATGAMRRYGWIAFWTQLTLSVVSGVILLFSVAFTSQVGAAAAGRCGGRVWSSALVTPAHSPLAVPPLTFRSPNLSPTQRTTIPSPPPHTPQSGPKASLYLTLVGILAGFLSTFWAYGYQRISYRMQEYLDGVDVAKIKKQAVRL